MGFDYTTYCLEWVTFFLSIGLIWPVLGIGIDIIIDGIERDVGPTGGK